jgi:S1-C subfamily serine protease/predicted esterase
MVPWYGSLAVLCLSAAPAAAQDLEALNEQAMKAAVQTIAPSVVQIETSGGTDLIGRGAGGQQVRKGLGPTTGLVVTADGYIISSAFNFANKPTAILVAVPGHKERLPAKVVATDQTRMLTLLKIEAAGLPVPAAAPKGEIRIGQWALALGRTWGTPDQPPSVSVGIVSALGRIWGRAVQTDAKVSPVNYGGPLADIQGRVIGVLVPASPRAQDETAGVEWYDSGIGFAIPLEDVNAVLPRLQKGQDLKRGLLGITLQGADLYGAAPVVSGVAPESAAAKAGIKPGDVILEIDGVATSRQAQVLHQLGKKYEGDTIAVKVKRGKEELALANVKLTGILATFAYPFLGVLPMRDDPEPGEEIRYVYPKSPAEAAGLKVGDRIMKIGQGDSPLHPLQGRDHLTTLLSPLPPGTEVKLEIKRKEGNKTEVVTVKLAAMPDSVPETLPAAATLKKALTPRPAVGPTPPRRKGAPPNEDAKKEGPKKEEAPKEEPKKEEPPKKHETGLLKRFNAARDHEYWLFVPSNYDPNIAHALVVWLHPAGKGKEADFEKVVEAWEDLCEDNHFLLLLPKAENEEGWLASEADFVQALAHEAMEQYTVDRQRVVAHGMGVGGQLAFYLGFHHRDLVRGVATTGAILATQPKEHVAGQRLSFFIVAGGKDPLAPAIAEGKEKLTERKFPVVYREIGDMGHQYLDEKTLLELVRWIDSLDRQ